VKRVWLMMLCISILLVGWAGFRSVEADGERCAVVQNQVRLLARPGEGRSFISLAELGDIPFLDPKTGETIVALRPLLTALSGPQGVRWDEQNRVASFYHDSHEITIALPQSSHTSLQAELDGRPFPLRAYLCDGRLHAPVRQVTDALGLEVRWYHADRTAVIDPVWTEGVSDRRSEAAAPGRPRRPAQCSDLADLSWADLLTDPLGAWDQTVRRTACAMLI
jgi:hypothetical protein